MWFDVIKKPYVIGSDLLNPDDMMAIPDTVQWKFNKLFQGSQGKNPNVNPNHRYEESTNHWTPILVEAVAYAFFGSFVVPSEKSSYKDIAIPTIKQALKTDQDFELRHDEGYANYKQGSRDDYMFINHKKNITPRGVELPVDYDYRMPNTPEFKYLPDSRVGELGKGLLKRMKNNTLTSKEIEAFRNSAGIQELGPAEKHLEMMLNKYFGGI